MSATKVAITMDETLLQRLDRLVKTRSFRSRSQVVLEAVSEKISRRDKSVFPVPLSWFGVDLFWGPLCHQLADG